MAGAGSCSFQPANPPRYTCKVKVRTTGIPNNKLNNKQRGPLADGKTRQQELS
jgi:hypothetical protein